MRHGYAFVPTFAASSWSRTRWMQPDLGVGVVEPPGYIQVGILNEESASSTTAADGSPPW